MDNEEETKRRAPAAKRGGERVLLGADSSNTAPPNTTVVHLGVDSLYLSYQGTLKGRYSEALRRRKEIALDERTESQAQIYLCDLIFKVHAQGKKQFKYVISNDYFHIQLSDRSAESVMPFALIQIRSEYLATVAPEQAVKTLDNIIKELGDVKGDAKVSRIDLFCDVVTEWNLEEYTPADFICRAAQSVMYIDGKHFTGFTFGAGGEISCRIYDKTYEIKKSHKYFFHDIWSQAGWKGEQVWRVEFQIKREALKELGLSNFDSVYGQREYLWNYLTNDWIRLLIASKDRRERWETHEFWKFIQSITRHSHRLVRLAKPISTLERRLKIIARYLKISLTEAMACDGENDVEKAHAGLLELLYKSYLPKNDEDLSSRMDIAKSECLADIAKTVARKRWEFSTFLNSTTSLTPPPEPDDENA